MIVLYPWLYVCQFSSENFRAVYELHHVALNCDSLTGFDMVSYRESSNS